ncbi:MAG TPA: DUF3795 domain-containing protein [Phycisphaerae bacterium]|nr:DUF3795 domain-containing protein [Phycisphaerae bacterium]
MKPIISDPNLVAYCGLYCGACRAYLRGRCPGCHENSRASWCKVRACCVENSFATCADCRQFADPRECGKFNNWVARLFALVFRSDRAACIRQVRQLGLQSHADDMAAHKRQTLRR